LRESTSKAIDPTGLFIHSQLIKVNSQASM
jgi:hypothetical protein